MDNKEQQKVKVEYIVIMGNQDDNSMGINQFENLLHTSKHIKIKKNTVEYQNTPFGYNIIQNKMTDDTSSCFDLTFTSTTENDNKIALFKDLLKEIRGICNRFNGNKNSCIIEMYNSLGAFYCEKAYRIIYELENLMRKLIYKFMIVNVGINWAKTDVPKEVDDSIKKENKQSEESYLHKLDFIQLSNLLFKKYSNNDIDDFYKSIKDKKDSDNIVVSDIRQYQKKSNWQKYFAKKVECEAEQLEKKWNDIYEIRCKVAHCRVLTEQEFNNLTQMNDSVKSTIESALNTIATITINKEEREQLVKNVSGKGDKNIVVFLRIYNRFFADVSTYLGLRPHTPSIIIINQLLESNLVDSDDWNRLKIIINFRNELVHFGYDEDPYRINKYTNTLVELHHQIINSTKTFNIIGNLEL